MNAEERAARARENFLGGYNCSQAVTLAFADVFGDEGIDASVLARLASPFGGGMGRLREVCGAVSGALMVLGVAEGYDDAKAFRAKRELYERVQAIAAAYRDENGSIVCRELLELREGPSEATPERRSEGYYRKRPCPELCACAARIVAEELDKPEP